MYKWAKQLTSTHKQQIFTAGHSVGIVSSTIFSVENPIDKAPYLFDCNIKPLDLFGHLYVNSYENVWFKVHRTIVY